MASFQALRPSAPESGETTGGFGLLWNLLAPVAALLLAARSALGAASELATRGAERPEHSAGSTTTLEQESRV